MFFSLDYIKLLLHSVLIAYCGPLLGIRSIRLPSGQAVAVEDIQPSLRHLARLLSSMTAITQPGRRGRVHHLSAAAWLGRLDR
jgi:hypothetical protein